MNTKIKLTLIGLAVSTSLIGCTPTEKTDQANDINNPEPTQSTNADGSIDDNTATNDATSVTIDTVRGDIELPINPHPIAVYDMTLMQDLAALGVSVDGLPDNLHLDNLKAADTPESKKPEIKSIGTLFEPDMEALNEMQPKAILVGSRMAEKYDTLNQMAPTLDLTLDTANIYESSKQRLADLGKLFNKADKAQALQKDIDDAIAKAKAASAGKGNALVILVNGNKISTYGEDSRFGFIHTVFGIPAADTEIKESRHGQPVSFEYLQKINPDWLFVLDRTSAIGEEGDGAEVVLDNPLVHQTKAWKNNNIVYLSPDSYLAFGGYYQWLKDANLVAEKLAPADSTQ